MQNVVSARREVDNLQEQSNPISCPSKVNRGASQYNYTS